MWCDIRTGKAVGICSVKLAQCCLHKMQHVFGWYSKPRSKIWSSRSGTAIIVLYLSILQLLVVAYQYLHVMNHVYLCRQILLIYVIWSWSLISRDKEWWFSNLINDMISRYLLQSYWIFFSLRKHLGDEHCKASFFWGPDRPYVWSLPDKKKILYWIRVQYQFNWRDMD